MSVARTKIEHTNGILKNRWSSLKCIPTQIQVADDIEKVNEWIVCCIVLHNLGIIMKDLWEYEDHEEGNDIPINVGSGNESGNALRERVKFY